MNYLPKTLCHCDNALFLVSDGLVRDACLSKTVSTS